MKLGLLEISVKSRFKFSTFQQNLLLLIQISMCRNFGFLEVAFQSLIYISIQIMFIMSKLSIKSINKPVKGSTVWPPVFKLIFYIKIFKYLYIFLWISLNLIQLS